MSAEAEAEGRDALGPIVASCHRDLGLQGKRALVTGSSAGIGARTRSAISRPAKRDSVASLMGCLNECGRSLCEVRVAADPVHGTAVAGEFYRPDKCWLCSPHHEQGSEFLAHGFWFRRGCFLYWLCPVSSACKRAPSTYWSTSLGFLHFGHVECSVDSERLCTKPNEFLCGALFPRCGRGGIFLWHAAVSDLLVSEDATCALHGVFHACRSTFFCCWRTAR